MLWEYCKLPKVMKIFQKVINLNSLKKNHILLFKYYRVPINLYISTEY